MLQKIQQHPEAFRSVLCYQPGCLTADVIMDGLFDIRWSEKGTNKRADESKVVAYWRDYLQDTEGGSFSKTISLSFIVDLHGTLFNKIIPCTVVVC